MVLLVRPTLEINRVFFAVSACGLVILTRLNILSFCLYLILVGNSTYKQIYVVSGFPFVNYL